MARSHTEELLILTKTYPSPSTKYRETTCVAAFNRAGALRRLYPIPFRFLDGEQQFRKWEWIQASVIRSSDDKRPESYRIDLDTIQRIGERVDTKHEWQERRRWIEPHIVPSFSALEARRQATGETLGFVRPIRLLQLEIRAVKDVEWTEADKAKLMKDGLFDTDTVRHRTTLKKLPYDFYYAYECSTQNGVEKLRHKITDWEAGALYWRCRHDYGDRWETYFRQRFEKEFFEKDLLFLMGTIHRFPEQWLIVGLIYPPKMKKASVEQLPLGLAVGDA